MTSDDASTAPRGARRAPPDARAIAAHVLVRVERDGAFAAAALDAELARHPQLDPRDRGLATEIAYGVLRTRGVLAARLAGLMPRGLPDDVEVVATLLVAAYQLLLLDRVPAHAAVDAAVTAIRRLRGPRVAGFANAVLRKLARPGAALDRRRAVRDGAPPWLLAALDAAVGEEETDALLGASDDPADTRIAVRVVAGVATPGWLAEASPGRVSPRARLVPRGGDLRKREGFAEGAFVIQEEGAQVVALALGARPGERVLDACAGRGQKTTLLRELVGPAAELWATDLHPEKLVALEKEHARLGLAPPRTAAVDLSAGTASLPPGFDRILVDAPCTGTGTLRHRPEIARRLGPADPARMAALQEAILRNAAGRARAGGRVVYAVCSVLPEEGEQVVARVADVLAPAPFDAPELAAWLPADATTLRLGPGRHGTDGFFVASLRRREGAP